MTGTNSTPIEDEILVVCITASIHHEKGKARVKKMQDYDILNDNEGIGIPAIHAITRPTDI